MKALFLLLLFVIGYWCAFFISTYAAVYFPFVPGIINTVAIEYDLAAYSTWGWIRYAISILVPALIVAWIAAKVIKLKFILSVIIVLMAAILGEIGLRLYLNEGLGLTLVDIFALSASILFSVIAVLGMVVFYE